MRLHALLAALPLAAAAGSAPLAQERPTDAPLHYARVTEADARVRNLADDKGDELARLAVGDLVAVFQERVGWLEVEVPGGLAVWVYGKYLQPTDEEGVYEVVRNGVNMRPEPKTDVTNFPLPQRLHAQDRVRGIEVLDPTVELAQTWVRIWSPQGVHAWLRASSVGALPAGADGAALWKAAEQALAASGRPAPLARVTKKDTAPSNEAPRAEGPSAEDRATTALARGREAMGAETPDLAAARLALEEAVRLSPGGASAVAARLELEKLALLEHTQALQADLAAERLRIVEETRRREAQVREASRRKDPLGGVFKARGVIVRRIEADGSARFFVRWGGELTAELLCSSGRYSLADFAGYEVGVHGVEQGGPASGVRGLTLIDVGRIEVVSRR